MNVIELFKMIKGIYDPMCIPCVEFRELSEDLIRTRGNRYKLIQHHCHYWGQQMRVSWNRMCATV